MFRTMGFRFARGSLALTLALHASCGGAGQNRPSAPSDAAAGSFCNTLTFTPAACSPYVLPFAVGSTQIMFQGNCSQRGGHRDSFAYDFDLSLGTPVHAARDGFVLFENDQYADTDHVSGHENNVFVRHADGSVIRYTHLRQGGVVVRMGDPVEAGTLLAVSGNSGASSGPHLHLQAFRDAGSFDAHNAVPLTFRNALGATRPSGELIEGEAYRAGPY
jgi:murein DD-endopeptidase MepM/ murein hydrolase activator NlpD